MGKRVLVVDGGRSLRLLLQELLADEAYEGERAANGLEAVAVQETSAYDVIVLDVSMPSMDGLQCVQSMRQQTKGVVHPAPHHHLMRCLQEVQAQLPGQATIGDVVTLLETLGQEKPLETVIQDLCAQDLDAQVRAKKQQQQPRTAT